MMGNIHDICFLNMNKGFTLIELLVVVAIIGILAAVGIVAYSGYTKSAKNATCHDNHKKIVKTIFHCVLIYRPRFQLTLLIAIIMKSQ